MLKLYSERLVKKLEKRNLELQQLEQRYRTLCENINDFIFVLNEEGYFTDANCRTEMFGYTLEDVIGKHFNEFLMPKSQEIALNYFGKSKKGVSERDLYEVEVIKRDGGIAIVELSMSTIYMEDKFIGRYGVARDITVRKQTEEALRKSEERYRSLFNGIPVGLYRTAPTGEIIDANPALAQILGYADVESLIGVRVTPMYVDPEDRKIQGDILKQSGIIRNYEIRLHRPDGMIVCLNDSVRAVYDAEGRVLYYEGSLEDITERKRAEKEMADLQEQLRQSQKMEAIGKLAGGVAHDFNNLLTVIMSVSQPMLLDLEKGSPLQESIEEILRAGERASSLTRQLLAFSRRQIMELKVLDLNVVLKDLEKMLHRIIGEDIELMILMGKDLGNVKSDPGQVEQVVMNLAVNARDAMPKASGRELADRLKSEIKVLYMSGYTDDAIIHHGVLEKEVNYIQKPFDVEGLAKKVREVLDK